MHSLDNLPALTPLQRAIYETDQLGLSLRDSIKIATQRMGFFVGQNKYLEERAKIQRFIDQYGPPPEVDATEPQREATHQIGSP
jgi:hypothetical protein